MVNGYIPAEQWAQVIEVLGRPPVYKRIPVPIPARDEALVNVLYSGVCHTDLHAMRDDWPLEHKMPLVGGHEGVGVVVAQGNLTDAVKIGDRVGIKWLNGTCLRCSFCLSGNEPLCEEALLSGYSVDGTFQQYCTAKASHLTLLPEDCDPAAIAPILCAGVTVYKGLKESGARPGQYVAIIGAAGGLGSMAIQFARAMGLQVIAVDRGGDKEEICKSLGAKIYVNYETSEDLGKDVRQAIADGCGAHAALVIASDADVFQKIPQYIRPHGVAVCLGLPAASQITIPVFDVVVKMLTIKGSYVGSRVDAQEAVQFFHDGLIKVPTIVVPLSNLADVYDLMSEGKIVGRYIIDPAN
ncbi:hypothetical protein VHEMI05874 [[Torrubiella] hemipterigena]|uniref:alcohol dehydrogenase n=1 Tax=[Torrubiella] hemipterigena TaxID=1531966 RepID=A0A0A1SZ18_9HYPO|nr:hypothetical protein VHEMI05874 [[Torrubiella] hemipterigena]